MLHCCLKIVSDRSCQSYKALALTDWIHGMCGVAQECQSAKAPPVDGSPVAHWVLEHLLCAINKIRNVQEAKIPFGECSSKLLFGHGQGPVSLFGWRRIRIVLVSHPQFSNPIDQCRLLAGLLHRDWRDGVCDEFLVRMARPHHACACQIGRALHTTSPQYSARKVRWPFFWIQLPAKGRVDAICCNDKVRFSFRYLSCFFTPALPES